MRLLYEWIKCDSSKIIEDCGINFSSDYSIEFNSTNNNLSIEKTGTTLPINFYSTDGSNTINQITCLVGKNGSGKSSILKHLYHTDVLSIDENINNNYPSWNTIQVFEKDNQIIVLHNQPDLNVKTALRNCRVTSVDSLETTKIFLTNDAFCYLNDHSVNKKSQLKIAFTPYDIDVLKSNFFDRILNYNTDFISAGRLYKINEFFKSKSNPNHFQNILYLVLLQHLMTDGAKDKFPYLRNMKIIFSKMAQSNQFINDFSYSKQLINRFTLERILKNKISDNDIDQEVKRLNFVRVKNEVLELCACYNYVEKNLKSNKETAYTNLLINLTTEILFAIYDLDINIFFLKSFDIDYLLGIMKEGIENYREEDDVWTFRSTKENELNYFKDAHSSLTKLEKILTKSNIIDEKDLTPWDNKELLDFLVEEFKSNNSYILKYIWVSLGCSAGERAFLNLFSWVNSIPYIKHFSNCNIEGVNRNILLFIDEPDLYCHPEWQRKMVSELIKMVETQYRGHNVHIILSTHSPLFLSDIPNENVIRLSRDENGKILAEKVDEKTFGANIFDLYNNSFFLDAFIGEFAQKKINDAIKVIASAYKSNIETTSEELYKASKIVDLIGEPVLKNKLYDMLSYIRRHK